MKPMNKTNMKAIKTSRTEGLTFDGLKLLSVLMFLLTLCVPVLRAVEVRIKDIAAFEGVRDNQLIGYGLVVGLEGTGDSIQNRFTSQAISNMLENMGITLNPRDFQMRNTAAAAVTATLPPFSRAGSRIDVTVSSMGSAKSIQGGILLVTPLKGADGQVYAVAQGPVSIGGYNTLPNRVSVRKNHSTVGRIPNGALVENEIAFNFSSQRYFTLVMHREDFTTTTRAVNVINKAFGEVAAAVDSRTIRLMIPERFGRDKVLMASMVENLVLEPDSTARVVVNERTGTIVFGEDVKISRVALAHGNITVTVRTGYEVSQPPALSGGETVVVAREEATVEEEKGLFTVMEGGAKISDMVKTLNSLGATPRDIIAVLQAIKSAGALQARLEII